MWNDVAFSIGFAVVVCFTFFLAIAKNIEEEVRSPALSADFLLIFLTFC